MYKIIFSCRSDVGSVRRNNEDNFYCNGVYLTPEERDKPFSLNGAADFPCVFAVCDGMGGESHGELASLTAVSTLKEHSEKIKTAALSGSVDEAVQSFISDANEKICSIMRKNYFRMGTTLALVVAASGMVRAYNIGDSRIYTFHDGELSRISEDHTIAEQKIKLGIITPAEARRDKSRHVLTRCLGIFDDEMIVVPNIVPAFAAHDGLKILLCSDGLTDMLSDCEIQDIIRDGKNTSSTVNALVESALHNGGRDNITCIMMSFQR